MCGGHHDDYNNRRKGVGGGGRGSNENKQTTVCEVVREEIKLRYLRYLKKKRKRKTRWNEPATFLVVVVACLFAFFDRHAEVSSSYLLPPHSPFSVPSSSLFSFLPSIPRCVRVCEERIDFIEFLALRVCPVVGGCGDSLPCPSSEQLWYRSVECQCVGTQESKMKQDK
jgi:hypothetical protein